jgi:hypothetical protein
MAPRKNPNPMTKARLLSQSGFLIVDASILKQSVMDVNDPLTQEDVSNGAYICYYCTAKVHPVAIGLRQPRTDEPYTFSPHFSLFDGESHIENKCSYLKRTNFSEIDHEREGLKRKPSERYPNRLSLDWLNPLKLIGLGTGDGIHDPDLESTDSGNSTLYSNWTAQNISSLVNHFLRSEDRHSRLFVPGIEVTTYDRIFEKTYFSENFTQDNLRIYFSQIIYTQTSRRIDNTYTFFLTDGTYDSNSRTPIVRAKLVLDAKNWMRRDIQSLRDKISGIKTSADELRGQGKLQKGKSLPWIFFLGYAESENDSSPRLLCDDLRLIELCVTDKLNDIPENPPYQGLQPEPLCDNNEPGLNEPTLDEENDGVNSGIAEPSSLNIEVLEVSESISDEYEHKPEPDRDELILNHPAQDTSDLVIPDLHQPESDIEPPVIPELEHLQLDKEPTLQVQHRPNPDKDLPINLRDEEIHRIRATRTKARQRKQRRILRKKAWKAAKSGFKKFVKPLIEQLVQFFRKR